MRVCDSLAVAQYSVESFTGLHVAVNVFVFALVAAHVQKSGRTWTEPSFTAVLWSCETQAWQLRLTIVTFVVCFTRANHC